MAARTLYVSRTLLNANDLIAWAKGQGFTKTLIDGDLHVTVAYSKEPFEQDGLAPSQTRLIAAQGERSLKAFGDGGKAIVLSFDSPDLHARWQELRDAGASWDWPGYRPHVTFTYEPGDIDLDAIEPFTGALHFGPEIFAEIDDDWSSKVAETRALQEQLQSFSALGPLAGLFASRLRGQVEEANRVTEALEKQLQVIEQRNAALARMPLSPGQITDALRKHTLWRRDRAD